MDGVHLYIYTQYIILVIKVVIKTRLGLIRVLAYAAEFDRNELFVKSEKSSIRRKVFSNVRNSNESQSKIKKE